MQPGGVAVGAAGFSVVIGCSPMDFRLARLPSSGPVAGEQALGRLSHFFLYPSLFLAAASLAPHPGRPGTLHWGPLHWGPRSACPFLSALSLLMFV